MTSDDPPDITAAELAELHRIRIGKPPSHAAPADAYRDPKACVKYIREQIERERRARWKGD